MNIQIILLVLAVSVVDISYSRNINDLRIYEESDSYEPLVPSYVRHKRQVYGSITPSDQGGARGTIGASGTLLNQNGHQLDGHGQISRNWKPNGPTEVGGGLNYQGPRGGASFDANHARHMGTDLNAQGNLNLWRSQNGRSNLDGTANYNQHFGGPGGRSRPNYGAGINFVHRF